ncbi:hypothetical protein M2139_001635 [Enterococcus sp. PF1-24]|uniref:phage tail tape measure protein n=1 Tax=unclassified Enterococcus TaxID=2608891 RepID=UPI002474D43F|nr:MULTISPECIES: phage tail tape measure protein [unclassified Enterococcus]MDH6364648.1 hypothetical protein [Enterococcus sp. PFB1-1]MDH6401749.1 hypothetical protein [Enterococcus sp. PF1-24]
MANKEIIDQRNLRKLSREIKEIQKIMNQLTKKRKVIKVQMKELSKAKKEIKTIYNQVQELKQERIRLNFSSKDLAKVHKQLQTIDRQLDQLQAKSISLQVDLSNLTNARNNLKSLEFDIANLNNQKVSLQIEALEIEAAITKIDTLRTKLISLGKEKITIEVVEAFEQSSSGGGSVSGGKSSNKGNSTSAEQVLGGITKALPNIFNAGVSGVSGVTSSFGSAMKTGDNIGKASLGDKEALSSIGSSLSKTGDKLFDIFKKGATVAINAGLSGMFSSVDIAGEFDAIMGEIEKTSGASTNQLEKLADKTMDLSMNTVFSANDISEAALKLVDSGADIDDIVNDSLEKTVTLAMLSGVSMEEAANAITNGSDELANYIDIVNDSGAAAKATEEYMSTWQGSIENTASSVETLGNAIGQKLQPLMQPFIDVIGEIANKMTEWIGNKEGDINQWVENMSGGIEKIITKIREFDFESFMIGIKDSFGMIKGLLDPIINIFKTFIELISFGDFEKGLGRLPGVVFSVAAAFKMLGGVVSALSMSGGSSGGGIGDALGGLDLKSIGTNFVNGAKNLALVAGAIGVIMLAAEAMQQVNEKVPDDWQSFIVKILSMAGAIAVMGILIAKTGEFISENEGAAIKGAAGMVGILIGLTAAAFVMEQFDQRVPDDWQSFLIKIGLMSAAIAAMGLLIVFLGNMIEGNEKEAAKGAAGMAGILIALTAAAFVMEQIDKRVPDDFKSFGTKLLNMGLAIVGMGVLAGILGANLVVLAAVAAGLAGIIVICEALAIAALAIEQVDQRVPDNMDSFAKKMDVIILAIGAIGLLAAAIGGAMIGTGGLLALAEGLGLATIAVICADLILAAEAIEQVEKKVPENAESVIKKLESIEKIINTFLDLDFGGIFDLFNAMFKNINLEQVISSFEKLADLSKEIEKINQADFTVEGATASLKALETITNELNSLGNFKVDLDDDSLEQTTESIEKLNELIAELEQALTLEYDETQAAEFAVKLSLLNQTVNEILSHEFKVEGSKLSDDLIKATWKLRKISGLVKEMKTIMEFQYDDQAFTDFEVKIEKVNSALVKIFEYEFKAAEGSEKGAGDLAKATTKLIEINSLVEEMKTIMKYEYDPQAFLNFEGRLGRIDSSVKKIFEYKFKAGENSSSNKKTDLERAKNRLLDINNLVKEMGTVIDFEFDANIYKGFSEKLGLLDELTQEILNYQFGATPNAKSNEQVIYSSPAEHAMQAAPVIYSSENVDGLEQATIKLNKLKTFTEAATKFIDSPVDQVKLQETLAKADEAIKSVNAFIAEAPESDDDKIAAITTGLTELVTSLGALNEDFKTLGGNFATSVATGWSGSNYKTTIAENIETEVTNIQTEKSPSFTTLGNAFATSLVSGFSTGLSSDPSNTLLTKLTEHASGLSTDVNLLNSFATLGKTLGDKIVSGLSSAVSTLKVTVNESTGGLIYPSTGGQVPVFKAKGGSIFKPQGTDTVPAMLTPGEWVHRTAAVRAFGTNFMDKVNKLDVPGVYNELTHRFIGKIGGQVPVTSMATVNTHQVTNNDPVVNQYFNRSNPSYSYRRAWRYA